MTDDRNALTIDTTRLESLRTITMVTYGLYALAIFLGVSAVVGLVVAYLKRGEAGGTLYASHLTWLIRTFWLTLIGGVIGVVTTLIVIGVPILFAVGIWYIYRVVKGFLRFNDRQPIADPQAWF